MKKKLIMLSLALISCVCVAVGFSACGSGSSSDSGTITDPFASDTHTHTLTAVEEKTATCTEAGNSAYWYCADCGKYYSDANATTEISLSSTVVNALGHDYETKFSWDYTGGVATASATGVCSRDSSHTETVTCTVAEDTSKTVAATCTENGSITYIATATFSDGSTDTESKTFDVDPTGHDSEKVTHYTAVAATATTEGNIEYWYCSDCGKYYSDSALTKEITKADTVSPVTASVSITTAAVTDTYDDGTEYTSEYSGKATLTIATAGVYKVELTTYASETLYIYYEVNGDYIYSYVDFETADQLVVEKGDVVTFYACDTSASEAETCVVTITRTGDVTAVVPTELKISGDTVATLDSTGRSYDLSYTATAATAGEYTFTLSGTDLTDVSVYIYKDGYYADALSSTSTTTTLLVAEGSVIEISASISSTATEAITFTLNTAVDTTAETRTGYYADAPITISSYSYDENLTVKAGETLYYVISGTRSYTNLHVDLTASSTDDAAFTVYGYSNYDTVTDYQALTATNGVYSFTLTSGGTRQYIKIVASAAGTINVVFEENADTLETTSYTLTTSTVKYVVETDGDYVFTVGSTEEAFVRVDDGDSVYIGTEEDYCVTILSLTSGQAVYMASYYLTGCTMTVTKGSAINSVSENCTVSTGDNLAVIGASDASTGVTATYTATAAGVYTFSIDSSDTDANVTVTTSTGSTTLKVGSSSYSTTLTVSYYLAENQQITLTFKTTSGSGSVYGLNIACTEVADLYQSIDATDSVTLTSYRDTSTESTSYVSYGYLSVSELTGNYYLTLTYSSSSFTGKLSVTLNGNAVEAASTDSSVYSNYSMTLTGNDKIIVTVTGANVNYYYTATLTSGTYTPLTTSINSSDTGTLSSSDSGYANAVVLSASDAKSYVTSFTADSTGGVYKFDVSSNGSVWLATSADNYSDDCYVFISDDESTSIVLEANQTIYVKLATYDRLEGSFTLTITAGGTAKATTVTTTTAELTTFYADINSSYYDYAYVAYATVTTDTTGDYHITIADDYDNIAYGSTAVTVTVDGTEYYVEGGVFNITLTASTTYNINVMLSYSDYYTYTIVLESGKASLSSVPSTLVTGTTGNAVTLTDNGAYGVTVEYTLAAGTYTMSIDTDTEDAANVALISVEIEGDSTYYYFTLSTATAYGRQTYYTSYEFTVENGDIITIYYCTTTKSAGSYNLYLNTTTATEDTAE